MPAKRQYIRTGWLLLCLGYAAMAALAGPARDRPQVTSIPPAIHAPAGNSATIHGLAQAWRRPDGALVVHGLLSGTGTVAVDHVVIDGTVSPGDSPGCIDFGGNVTFNLTSTLIIEIAGTTPCSEYDRISVAGTLTLNSSTLALVLLTGFTPAYGDRFHVLDWGTLVGTFGNIDSSAAPLPFPLLWDVSQLYLSGEIVVGVQHIADGDLAPWNNPDGQINAADYLIATQLVMGNRAPGALQLANGDMDSDGDIDLIDLLLIQQLVLP